MAEAPKTIDVPIRLVLAERDDGAEQQRRMAEHCRSTGRAWLELADSLDAFADYLDTLPMAETREDAP